MRERADRMDDEYWAYCGSEWAAMASIAAKIGWTAETLRRLFRDEGSRPTGPAALVAKDRDRLKLLDCEVKELIGRLCMQSFVNQTSRSLLTKPQAPE